MGGSEERGTGDQGRARLFGPRRRHLRLALRALHVGLARVGSVATSSPRGMALLGGERRIDIPRRHVVLAAQSPDLMAHPPLDGDVAPDCVPQLRPLRIVRVRACGTCADWRARGMPGMRCGLGTETAKSSW